MKLKFYLQLWSLLHNEFMNAILRIWDNPASGRLDERSTMTFELILGMQVVTHQPIHNGTSQEYLISTWYGDDIGWVEITAPAISLDHVKNEELAKAKNLQEGVAA